MQVLAAWRLQSKWNQINFHATLIGDFRYLLAEDYFHTIDVFEQQASFGGVWNYTNELQGTIDIPQINPHQPLEDPIWRSAKSNGNGVVDGDPIATFVSPMYEHLEANIPHLIMKHSDKPLEDNQLFPSRETILTYLEEYAQDIQHLVHFQTQVTDVRLLNQDGQDAWIVKSKDLRTHKLSSNTYDAVIVANGHYTVPSIPSMTGMEAWNEAYPGLITHSKHYRRPSPYTNKKVLIVGNSASGTDIASQIATVSLHPLLLSSHSKSELFPFSASYKQDVPEIVEFLPSSQFNRAVRFANDKIETDLDAILFATGYHYSFPFLSSLNPPLSPTGARVENLYQHIFYITSPSLAFIGLPSKIVPFRTFESQAALIARVWAGRLSLPPDEEMREWEREVVKKRGEGRGFHVLPYPTDFEYHDFLVEWAGKVDGEGTARGKRERKWDEKEYWAREIFPAIKAKFTERGEGRHGVKTIEELGFDYEVWMREQGRNGDEKK